MIEVPRAALLAGDIAAHADFFSFGTNDLTQMVFGFSRDDVATFLPQYVEQGILVGRSVSNVGRSRCWSARANGRRTGPGGQARD